MRSGARVGLGLLLLAVCRPERAAPELDCARTSCGCSTDAVLEFSARVVNTRGTPVKGATVTCESESAPVARAGGDGRVSFRVETRYSPGCHWERCQGLTFADPTGGLAPVEMTVFQANGTDVVMR